MPSQGQRRRVTGKGGDGMSDHFPSIRKMVIAFLGGFNYEILDMTGPSAFRCTGRPSRQFLVELHRPPQKKGERWPLELQTQPSPLPSLGHARALPKPSYTG